MTGINVNYDTSHMQWYGSTLPMHPLKGTTCADIDNMKDIYHIQFEDELLSQD
jgi:hypothetical protein